jgi:hypothetical protein
MMKYEAPRIDGMDVSVVVAVKGDGDGWMLKAAPG